jgi:two-component system, sensor histidine kinase and response regulator
LQRSHRPQPLPGREGRSQSPASSILIVDDRPENLVALAAVLEELEQNVVRAASGKEALREVLREDFAVILLDVQLPGIDGFETARLIRERERSNATPIIFLTAFDNDAGNASRGYSLGAVDFLTKPYDPEVLRAKVRVFIELHQRRLEVDQLNASLERRVLQRTSDLEAVNAQLLIEISERQRAERGARQLAEDLEARVAERTAALKVAVDELEAFSYSIAHDLRAPLRKVEMFTELLLEDGESAFSERGLALIDRMIVSVRYMDSLITELMRLSRVSRTELEYGPVDLSEMVRAAVREHSNDDAEREVNLDIKASPPVTADRRLLRLAVSNLVSNAWKFTGRRERAFISFDSFETDDSIVYVLRDNGAGFAREQAAKLFQPFQRLHDDAEYVGHGIGLAIVRRVIERHGGKVWAEGLVDEGAAFYFSLPRAPAGIPA